jgi:hypothetical protein
MIAAPDIAKVSSATYYCRIRSAAGTIKEPAPHPCTNGSTENKAEIWLSVASVNAPVRFNIEPLSIVKLTRMILPAIELDGSLLGPNKVVFAVPEVKHGNPCTRMLPPIAILLGLETPLQDQAPPHPIAGSPPS